MATTYRIVQPVAPSGYKGMILIAFLFRVVPDAKVTYINGYSQSIIPTIPRTWGHWSDTIVNSAPLISLNMRTIYSNISTMYIALGRPLWIGKIKGSDMSSVQSMPSIAAYNWYYAMCAVEPLTGVPTLRPDGLNDPMTIIIDDSSLGVNEPRVENATMFGLSESAACDGSGYLKKYYPSPVNITN